MTSAAIIEQQNRLIVRLRDEIRQLRNITIERLPPEQQSWFYSVYHAKNQEALWKWQRQTIAAIIASAKPLTTIRPSEQSRAECPLCGASGTTPQEPGYSLPDGLERHLLGTHRARICPVFRIAIQMAEDVREDMSP